MHMSRALYIDEKEIRQNVYVLYNLPFNWATLPR